MIFILMTVILVLTILLGFLGWLFLVYFRSYTKIVEGIYRSDKSQKEDFSKEIEVLKTSINQINSKLNSCSFSNNNAILNEWLNGGDKVE